MCTIEETLKKLEVKGVHLFLEGEKLRYKAAKELMTTDVMAELKARKDEIVDYLKSCKQESAFVIDRTNRYEPFPLTDVQSAYLMGRSNLFEYGGVACHVYLEIKYDNLDASKVSSIWNKLTTKYDMLHAVIDEAGFQQVLKEVPTLEVPEWNLETHPEQESQYAEFTREMGSRAYTIGKWPMFGIAVSRHSGYSLLHFSIEFLIADWTSIWKLIAEFEGAYFDGKDIQDDEEISFRDYLVAEKKIKASIQYEKEKKYWMDRIASLPEAPELPKMPVSADRGVFGRKFLRLSQEEWTKIKERAKYYGITPTVPILSSYADVLGKWSTSKKFCINMTVLNRLPLHEKVMEIVGDFTSLSLLAVDSRAEGDFLSRTRKINGQLFADLDNRLFSGVEVMREIARQGKKSGISMPIVYTSAIGLADSGTPLRGEFCGGISQTPQTFIDCQVMDGAFGLQINWDFREGVFPAGVLDAMFEIFEKRLHELACKSDWTNIDAIVIPQKDAEERKVANTTSRPWNVRLLQADFRQRAKEIPEKIAVDDGVTRLTYGEVDRRARALANLLVEAGVKAQECVPVLMEKSVWQVVSVLGILYARAIYVPIASSHAQGRARKIIEKTGCTVLLAVSGEVHEEAEGYKLINVDEIVPEKKILRDMPQGIPEDIAYIIYTSGSTGEPKGVVISHRGAMNTIDDMNRRFCVTGEDGVLGLSQLNFDLSVYDIFGILGVGGTLYYPPKEQRMNPEYWECLIREKNITVWNSVPALMKMLLNFVENSTSKVLPLKNAFLSGDWIPLDMPEQIQKYAPDCEVICLGGATEASIWSNYHRYNKNDNLKILPYGVPLSNQTMHILDENLDDCPIMVSGQIALGGEGVALGYYGDKERTEAQFVNLPRTGERVYLTGDIGRYLPGGEIEFLGRKDNQVKIRGHRIELGEIENVFKEHPQIREAVAVVNSEKSEINVMLQAEQYNAEKRKEIDGRNKVLFESVNTKISQKMNEVDWPQVEGTVKRMEMASAYSILYALMGMGAMAQLETPEEIAGKIPEQFRWHTGEWLRLLEANGLVKREDGRLVSVEKAVETKRSALWNDLLANWNELIGDTYFARALRLYGEHFKNFLDMSEDPQLILARMSDGDKDDNRSSFENWTKIVQSWNAGRKLAECIKIILEELWNSPSTQKSWRILELGAGAGQVSKQIIPFLRCIGCQFEYLYTDYQTKFFPPAKEYFAEYSNICFKRLDINSDFEAQGVEAQSVDIVIAAEVLDNAFDIKMVLERITRVVKPSGYAFVLEPYGESAWLSISQTLMMDRPEDSLREQGTFLPASQWKKLLDGTDGHENTVVYPMDENHGKTLGVNLFVKQIKSYGVSIDREGLPGFMDKYLLNYMHPSHIEIVEKFPLSANGKIDRKAIKEFFDERKMAAKSCQSSSEASPLEKQIIEVWSKTLNAPDLGLDSNFYDFGADSLMMAQVTTALRNQLNLKEPFDVLLKQMLDNPTARETAAFLTASKVDADVPQERGGILKIHRFGKPRGKKLRVLLPSIFWNLDKFKYLIPLLEAQDEGEIIAFTMNDAEAFENLHPSEVGTRLAELFLEPVLEGKATEIQIITYCYISPIGLEMAERLLAEGIKVRDIAIIDGSRLGVKVETSFIRRIFFAQLLYVDLMSWGLDAEELVIRFQKLLNQKKIAVLKDSDILAIAGQMENGEKVKKLLSMDDTELLEVYRQYSQGFGNNVESATVERLYRLFDQSMNVMLNYTPAPYFGNIRYLKAHNEDGIFRYFDVMYHEWDELCLGDMEIMPIPGNHFSCLTDPELVKSVAERLKFPSKE